MPYGEMLMELSNQQYNNPYKYNSKEFNAATGYYDYGARYYDLKQSFWLSVDPLADISGSPYAYVWNDPAIYADPSGMMGERVGGEGPGDPKKVYGPKEGKLIEGVVIKGVKKSNIAYSFLKMCFNLDKGVTARVQDYLLVILIKFVQMLLQME